MRSLMLGVVVCFSVLAAPVASAGPIECYDRPPVVDDELRSRGLVINQACVGNPYDAAVWADLNFRYESGDVDGGPAWTCEEHRLGPDPHDDVKLYLCHGDSGPHSNYTVFVDFCARLDPLKNTGDAEPNRCQ